MPGTSSASSTGSTCTSTVWTSSSSQTAADFRALRGTRHSSITAAPLGMGAALLVFLPSRMSFDQYFQMGSGSAGEKAARFLVGLSPSMLQMGYLVDPSRLDLAKRTGPLDADGLRPLCGHRSH
jgi:hypothetical protein